MATTIWRMSAGINYRGTGNCYEGDSLTYIDSGQYETIFYDGNILNGNTFVMKDRYHWIRLLYS